MGPVSGPRDRWRGKLTREVLWHISLTILVFSTFLIVLFRTAADPDLWGHLRFGLDNLQAGKIIEVDTYSFVTSGQRWINHEWLAEVVFAVAWNALGELGLILVKAFTGFLTLGILYVFLLRRRLPANQILLLLLMGALPLVPFLFHVRPQMFTYLFFTIVMIIVYQAENRSHHWLYAVPPLIALWVNFHGGVLAGVGIACLWAALRGIVQRQEWRRLSLFGLLSVAALLVNPYGADLLAFLLRTATVPRPEIEDWQPLALVSGLGFMYLFVLVSSVVGIALSPQKRNPVLLFLFGIGALLPWLAMRHLPLFSLAAVILVGEHIGSAWQNARPPQQRESQPPVWLAGLPLIASALILAGGTRLDLNRIHILEKSSPPDAAVQLIQESGVAGNLATEFDWGEYILWHLGPEVKVSIDGRRETVYPEDVYRQNIQFMFGTGAWDLLLKEHPVDMALVKNQAPNDNLLALAQEWKLVFKDENSALYVKYGSPIAHPLEEAANSFVWSGGDLFFP